MGPKVFGIIGLTRPLYPALRTRQGVVVNVISAAGEQFDPDYLAGSAGNAVLMAFAQLRPIGWSRPGGADSWPQPSDAA